MNIENLKSAGLSQRLVGWRENTVNNRIKLLRPLNSKMFSSMIATQTPQLNPQVI